VSITAKKKKKFNRNYYYFSVKILFHP